MIKARPGAVKLHLRYMLAAHHFSAHHSKVIEVYGGRSEPRVKNCVPHENSSALGGKLQETFLQHFGCQLLQAPLFLTKKDSAGTSCATKICSNF